MTGGSDRAPKEHGMPFSDRLVQATMIGDKYQTRRLIGWHNSECGSHPIRSLHWESGEGWPDRSYHPLGMVKIPGPHETAHRVWCRYQPRDTLWVREAWATWEGWTALAPSDLPDKAAVFYRADEKPRIGYQWKRAGNLDMSHATISEAGREDRWRPSIHMPRWASRILLEVDAVDAERIQDISHLDILGEGCNMGPHLTPIIATSSLRENFRGLWNETNGHRDGASWEDNPLVWAVRFTVRKIHRPPRST